MRSPEGPAEELGLESALALSRPRRLRGCDTPHLGCLLSVAARLLSFGCSGCVRPTCCGCATIDRALADRGGIGRGLGACRIGAVRDRCITQNAAGKQAVIFTAPTMRKLVLPAAAIAWASTAAGEPASCAAWPSAALPLVLPTGEMSGETAALASLPAADATIVGLYYGD